MGNREQWDGDFETEALGFQEEEGAPIKDFRDLEVWKAAMDLATAVYALSSAFPADERYGLTSQMRRAGVSIPTNIAEGYGRETSGAYVQFLRIAQGSAKELETLIELANRLSYFRPDDAKDLNMQTLRISRMLRGLIRAIKRRI